MIRRIVLSWVRECLVSVRYVFIAAAAALLGDLVLVTPGVALAAIQPATADAYALGSSAMGAGRVWSGVAVLVGAAGVVIGGAALARSAGRLGSGTGRNGAVVATVAGVASAVVGGLVVAAAEGGPGSGYGIAGGVVAVVVGLVATVVGGLALARSRR